MRNALSGKLSAAFAPLGAHPHRRRALRGRRQAGPAWTRRWAGSSTCRGLRPHREREPHRRRRLRRARRLLENRPDRGRHGSKPDNPLARWSPSREVLIAAPSCRSPSSILSRSSRRKFDRFAEALGEWRLQLPGRTRFCSEMSGGACRGSSPGSSLKQCMLLLAAASPAPVRPTTGS